MPKDFYSAYNSLSAAKKQEAYNFVMFLASYEEKISSKKKSLSAFGALNKYANPSLIKNEKGAWEKFVAEKILGRTEISSFDKKLNNFIKRKISK